MTTDTSHFKKKLLAEKDALESELATVARKNPTNPKDWEPVPDAREDIPASRDDTADKIESFEENIAITRQLEARLAEVRDALERIENRNYGRCISCGNAIETDRLHANPAAQTCKAHLAK